ncbi:MAG: hypothetical protein Q9195_008801 [Heterodermia aff. obscurata]
MQTLWARAAQRCTCNCILCHSSATALNRRATTAVLKRRIRFRDIFTLLYSSFLASAAIADVSRKEAKKAEWERLIKEARDELKALQEQQQARLAAVSWPDDAGTEKIYPRPNDWSGLLQWATKERDRRKSLGFQELKGPPMSLLEDASAPEIEELMFDKYIARLNAADKSHLWYTTDGHRPLSIKKVKTLEWSVRKLVHRLILSQLETLETNSEEQSDQAPTNYQLGTFAGINSGQLKMKIDRCDRRLSFLKRHSSNTEYWYRFVSPSWPTYSRRCRDDLASADSLNPELHNIFKCVTCDIRKEVWLAEVCSVLLFSYVPPDIHTYNLLIIYLVKLKQMADVEIVIESMHESHIRPNEVTLSAMLKFYTINNNKQGFLSLLRRIDGRDGGLSLAHAATEISPIFSERYQVSGRVPRIPVRISEEEEGYYYETGGYNFRPLGHQPRAQCHNTRKVVERARMAILDKAVYGAMIHGALKFLGPKKAMQYYSQMVSDGWEGGIRELGPILRYHSVRRKWQAGLAVWQEICKLPEGANRAAIECMLWLCRKCQKHILFGQVLDYGVRQELIPPTVWHFTNKIGGGKVTDLLRSADFESSVMSSALPITIARDFFERSLEALGYGIASIALDLADTTLEAPHPLDDNTDDIVSTALRIYFNIRQLHKDSPVSSVHTARQVALQSLAKKSRTDKELQGKSLQEVWTEDMERNSVKMPPLLTSQLTPHVEEKGNNAMERAAKEKHKPDKEIQPMPALQLLDRHSSQEYPQIRQTAILKPQSACQSTNPVPGDLEPQSMKTIEVTLSNTNTQPTMQLATKDVAAKTDQQKPEHPPAIHPLPSPPAQHPHLNPPPLTEQILDLSTSPNTPTQTPPQPPAEQASQTRKLWKRLTLRAPSDTSPQTEPAPLLIKRYTIDKSASDGTSLAPPPSRTYTVYKTLILSDEGEATIIGSPLVKRCAPRGNRPRRVQSYDQPMMIPRSVGEAKVWRPLESGSKLGDDGRVDGLVGA